MLCNEFTELPLGISVQLTGEVEEQTLILGLESAPERDSESLKISDGSRPLERAAAYERRPILSALRRCAIRLVYWRQLGYKNNRITITTG